jgi:hypothetical protein
MSSQILPPNKLKKLSSPVGKTLCCLDANKDNRTTPAAISTKQKSFWPRRDWIPNLQELCNHTRSVINRVFEEQIVPLCWKTGSMTVIYKKEDAKDPTNYRPICISNTASKLFTSYLQNHIDHRINSSHQLRKASETTSVDACNINFSYRN